MANIICHHYKGDRRQQTGFFPVVPTLLKLKQEKRPPFGEKKLQHLWFGLKTSALHRPKLTPPSSEDCPIPMEKTSHRQLGWSCFHLPPSGGAVNARWKMETTGKPDLAPKTFVLLSGTPTTWQFLRSRLTIS